MPKPDELLESVLKRYEAYASDNKTIGALQHKAEQGTADIGDAQRLSGMTGKELGSILASEISGAYEGAVPEADALRLIPPALRRNHKFVSDFLAKVQKADNEKAGLGLSPVLADFDEERAENLAKYAAGRERFADHELAFEEFVENNSRAVVDDSVREEAEEHRGMGLSPTITRVSSGHCCEWCDRLAGTYPYSRTMDKEVFRRHANCDCVIEYDPGTGAKDRQRVNNYRKTDVRSPKQIAFRKEANLPPERIPGKLRALAVEAAQEGYAPAIPTDVDGKFDDFEPLDLSKEEEKSMRALRDAAMSTGFEYSQVIGENGVGEIHTDNLPNRVRFVFSGVDGDHLKVYHSHTNVTPPSGQDFLLFSDPRVDVIGSVAPNGDCFKVKFSGYEDRPTREEINEAIKRISVQAQEQMMRDPRFESWTPRERTYMTIRENAYQMARELGCEMQGGRLK